MLGKYSIPHEENGALQITMQCVAAALSMSNFPSKDFPPPLVELYTLPLSSLRSPTLKITWRVCICCGE